VDAARREYESALASAREASAVGVEAEALYALGYVLAFAKEWDQAYAAFESSGILYERLDDRLGLTLARYSKAFTSSLAGRWADAAPGVEEVLPEFDALGEDFWRYTARLVLGRTLQRLGQLDRAEDLAREGLAGSAMLHDETMRAMALRDLAAVASMRGDHGRALRLVGASRMVEETIGGRAPDELVNILDPIELAGDAGVTVEEIQRLVQEGRSLTTGAAQALANADPSDRAT
jgi:tetratricopeptide (TPR) repeat protein